jgi:hypothetical protein
MNPRHWWTGVVLLLVALSLHALVPRYEWHPLTGAVSPYWVRVDRWTGDAQVRDLRTATLNAEIDQYLATLKK